MIDGSILVGAEDRRSDNTFRAVRAATGEEIGPAVSEANARDVEDACAKAEEAAVAFAGLGPARRAAFLDAIGEQLLAIGLPLIETAMAETGLPRTRLENERGRTISQLGMFADELRRGEWLDVVIDAAPAGGASQKPDLRRMNLAVGPVAVFGASNFPLAFSVAGGDTASAFAAGCPVVVKGHPAHPGTGELVARAVRSAAARTAMPDGVFSFLPGRGHALGSALVADPRIRAVGFTGSRSGGLALVAVAQARNEPIPVYAEMSSINPVVLLPHALASAAADLGRHFAASLTLGAGQFCTNPGLVIGVAGADLENFIAAASEALGASAIATMLTAQIRSSFEKGVAGIEARPTAQRVGGATADGVSNAALFKTDFESFTSDLHLQEEVFGASAIVVACRSTAEMARAISSTEGQLTMTIHCAPEDAEASAMILPAAVRRAGRVIANGWPTGVEVSRAMVHGGPFPATSDGRTTSVGTLAMSRFLRPVCFQDVPQDLLPPPLQDDDPWRVRGLS